MLKAATETIVAIATPPGAGGIGIIRISGGDISTVAGGVLASGTLPPPRRVVREKFIGGGGELLDDGVCLYFAAPHSFTGQEVLELHGHGGGAALRDILARCLQLGARLATAGEFTLRAYLNNKMDLAQAEAVADLINANTVAAARAAANSLSGTFSRRANAIAETLTALRADVEAALDFADEETGIVEDFTARIHVLRQEVAAFLAQCERGARLASGMTAAIVGAPNAGKSSLLNQLCGEDAAIVAAVAGTTRDLVVRDIEICGMAVRLIDTAGLRDGAGEIEKEGMARAINTAATADIVLLVCDDDDAPSVQTSATVLLVQNKTDIRGLLAGRRDGAIYISAKSGAGVEELRAAIAEVGGMGETLPAFSARARHVAALGESLQHIGEAEKCGTQAEVAAAWLASAHGALSSLTGAVDDEKLLGEIFSRFCIGK